MFKQTNKEIAQRVINHLSPKLKDKYKIYYGVPKGLHGDFQINSINIGFKEDIGQYDVCSYMLTKFADIDGYKHKYADALIAEHPELFKEEFKNE